VAPISHGPGRRNGGVLVGARIAYSAMSETTQTGQPYLLMLRLRPPLLSSEGALLVKSVPQHTYRMNSLNTIFYPCSGESWTVAGISRATTRASLKVSPRYEHNDRQMRGVRSGCLLVAHTACSIAGRRSEGSMVSLRREQVELGRELGYSRCESCPSRSEALYLKANSMGRYFSLITELVKELSHASML